MSSPWRDIEKCGEVIGRRETARTQRWCAGSFAPLGAELGRFPLFRVQDVTATSGSRVLGPVGAGTGDQGVAGWEAWLGTTLAEGVVHVVCSAGPLPQNLWGSCTGSPAGTLSGQKMGLPRSCQQQPTFGLVSLYSKVTRYLLVDPTQQH